MRGILGASAVGGAVLAAVGCGNNDAVLSHPAITTVTTGAGGAGGTGGMGGSGGAGPAKGVGDACKADKECRTGLACDAKLKTCQPAHTTVPGGSCTLSDECSANYYCASGACAMAGNGQAGAACFDDGQCQAGLRCTLGDALLLSCQPAGKADVGKPCTKSADCLAGLMCDGGSCAAIGTTGTTFGKPFAGASCQDDAGPVQAYFRVPRHDGKDGDFFRLPFPNDVRLAAGALDLSDFPTPGPAYLGYDLVKGYVDLAATSDGWSVAGPVWFRFSGTLDPATFAGQVQLVDLDADATAGFNLSYSAGPSRYICNNRVSVSRLQGRIWEPGKHYAVLLLDGLKAKDGTAIVQAADLAALLAAQAPADPALAAPYAGYQKLRDYLGKHAIAPAKVVTATTFTIGHPRLGAEAIAAAVAAAAPPTASGWVRCDTGVMSPCPNATGERACQKADPAFDELHALVDVPIFEQGTAPYLTAGGDVQIAGGVAKVAHTDKVCLSLTVPIGAAPGAGWPTLVFAHGTGGHFRTHVVSGIAAALAAGVDDGTGATVKGAVLGIDQVLFGTRAGGSTVPADRLFLNAANPKALRGNALQAAADQLSLAKLVPTIAFTAQTSPTKTAFKLSGALGLWGFDAGAVGTTIALPYGTWRGALVAGIGAGYRDLFVVKQNPWDLPAALGVVIEDADVSGKLRFGSDHPVLAVMQIALDGADPLAYGHVIDTQHVFQQLGLQDTFTPDGPQAAWALGANLALAAHDPSAAAMPVAIGNLATTAVPISGNRASSKGPITAVVREYGHAPGKDGHTVTFDATFTNSQNDARRFVAGLLSGIVPRVGK